MSENAKSKPKPNDGQFQKGRSGNPRGRPPSRQSFSAILEKPVTMTLNGVVQEITVEEAIQHRIFRDALKGKAAAIREVTKWLLEVFTWSQRHTPKRILPSRTRRTAITPRNADAALKLLGIIADDPRHMHQPEDQRSSLLLPWAVQAALSRRRSARLLTEKNRRDIKMMTIDPETLRWPQDRGR